MNPKTSSLVLGLLAATLIVAPFLPAVEASSTFAWGDYLSTSFYSGNVVGLQAVVVPYWGGTTAWGGTNESLAWVLTALDTYDEANYGTNPAPQIALLVEPSTTYLDLAIEYPGASSLTLICTKCYLGTNSQTLQVVRITNGWDYVIDGTAQASSTCSSCYSSDYIDQSYNQVPIAIEATSAVSKSDIDNSFAVSYSTTYYEQAPVGSGTFSTPSYGYSYLYNAATCTNFQVGSSSPPSWVASDGYSSTAGVDEIGTTTYLTHYSCGTQIW